ncbi:uncharacterized protein LOC122074445 [Macadamia integrifolia]|uniref:uncharacterized protein LOC122074445 n=1 Tax=Macadamia integrifolia TaxID=60698 RepID=UPI001C4E8B4E|nr:uncharacterized protein LOC122074445 [Macadamia integrifolia]
MANVWKRSPFKVYGQPIRFQRWRPDFNMHHRNATTKLVWIHFPELPFEYWHERILCPMAKAVGRHLDIDKRTRNASIGNFARILVEMENSDQRLEEIQVERQQLGIGDLFWFTERILYEDAMGMCGFCKCVGHTIQVCKDKKIANAKRNERDKVASRGVAGVVWVEKRPSGTVDAQSSGNFQKESNFGKTPMESLSFPSQTIPTNQGNSLIPCLFDGNIVVDLSPT